MIVIDHVGSASGSAVGLESLCIRAIRLQIIDCPRRPGCQFDLGSRQKIERQGTAKCSVKLVGVSGKFDGGLADAGHL